MSDRIEPGLTAEEWANVGPSSNLSLWGDGSGAIEVEGAKPFYVNPEERPAALIALFNAALPDSDPRKITREMIASLRRAQECAEYYSDNSDENNEHSHALLGIVDALSSYLPPEP